MRRYRDDDSHSTRRHAVISRPTLISSIGFDDLYEEISDRWLERAKRLQARRWRKIKNQLV